MPSSEPLVPGSWYTNPDARDWTCDPAPPGVRAFHRGLGGYRPTPAVDVPSLAEQLGVRRVVVKDESSRLGLPAFKGLGVSYAISRVIRARAGGDVGTGTWEDLRDVVAGLPAMEFVAATDGNHGRAVARFARVLGAGAHVIVPDAVAPTAVEAIRGEGARVSVLAEDYDTTVRRAAEAAQHTGGAVLVQDTAWPGYEEVPQWIVDGYSTLLTELDEQLGAHAGPLLVVTPMGVGSLVQAVVTHYRSRANPDRVAVLGVEPDTASCVQASLRAGRLTSVVTGRTIMDGLNCGTPSSLAWCYLEHGLDGAVSVSDEQAADAVEALTALGVPGGPCGAATLAAARLAVSDPALRAELGVDADTGVVLLGTEAAHDPSTVADPERGEQP